MARADGAPAGSVNLEGVPPTSPVTHALISHLHPSHQGFCARSSSIMDDSGFEEDHVTLLAELTSQALLHRPVSLDLDPMSNLEALVAAAQGSSLPSSSSAFLYGFLVCVQETMRFLTEVERLPSDHPIVSGMYAHLLNEYVNISTRLCAEATSALSSDSPPLPQDHSDAEPLCLEYRDPPATPSVKSASASSQEAAVIQ